MSTSPEYCRQNPEWAAAEIDELERRIAGKFFGDRATPCVGSSDGWQKPRTKVEIEQALQFADALDYSYGYIAWVDAIKTLAWALRSNEGEG